MAHRVDVQRLAADHAARAGGAGQFREHAQSGGRGQGVQLRVFGDELKGQGLQGVTDQDGRGLVIGLVAGGATAAQFVVVHRRQVVVHQRIGVDQLDGTGGHVEAFDRCPQQFAGGMQQDGTEALAIAQHHIAHGLVQATGGDPGGGQAGIQRAVGAPGHLFDEVGQRDLSHRRRVP